MKAGCLSQHSAQMPPITRCVHLVRVARIDGNRWVCRQQMHEPGCSRSGYCGDENGLEQCLSGGCGSGQIALGVNDSQQTDMSVSMGSLQYQLKSRGKPQCAKVIVEAAGGDMWQCGQCLRHIGPRRMYDDMAQWNLDSWPDEFNMCDGSIAPYNPAGHWD